MAEKIATLNIGEDKFESNTDNTFVFRFAGSLAVYDHVYVRMSEDTAYYMWSDHPCYDELSRAAAQAKAIIHLNLQDVCEADRAAFMQNHTQDLGDTIPTDWQ